MDRGDLFHRSWNLLQIGLVNSYLLPALYAFPILQGVYWNNPSLEIWQIGNFEIFNQNSEKLDQSCQSTQNAEFHDFGGVEVMINSKFAEFINVWQ